MRRKAHAAIKAAGLEPKKVFTHRQLDLAELEGSPSEIQKMLMPFDEADDLDMAASREAGEAERALCETAPTTREDVLRLLRHLTAFLDEDDVVNDLYLDDVVGDSIRNAITVLERESSKS